MDTPPPPHAVLWHGHQLKPTSPQIQALTERLTIAPVDQAVLRGEQLTVAELVALKQFASRTPTASHHKLVVITAAERLSPAVANALLKLVEEPPAYLLIRLNAANATAVLPTLRSRCQLEFIGYQAAGEGQVSLAELRSRSLAEQFALAEQLAADEALPAVIAGWLAELEQELLQGYPVSASIAAGLHLVDRVRSNSNRRLALESWLLNHTSGKPTRRP